MAEFLGRIQRYQKRGGSFIPQSGFNIPSVKQAYQVVDLNRKRFPERQGE